ncbi:MAG: porphobilinogen synthase [Rhodospirillaceae bacterium]|nr:MAG: porphobilinogen synthase [Rhodospirillaceae bacterium]
MTGKFPAVRPRRLRAAPWVRRLVRETTLTAADLVQPLFVVEGSGIERPIPALPGVDHLSIDRLIETAKKVRDLGIPAVALFPVIAAELKTADGRLAVAADGLVPRAVRAIKAAVPEIGIICDVALDPYTDHGHDGLIIDGKIANDATVEVLVRQALVLAEAGCDVVAPSDMMDGRIGAIRTALEQAGHTDTMILSYAVKYASVFYGPFRAAVGSASALGVKGKHTYQMDAANRQEALREVALDVAEGADLVMVKPGMPYLDVIADVRAAVSVPVFAYQVSGEYAMLTSAAAAGAFDFLSALQESLIAFKRAGASGILTYGALAMARYLADPQRRADEISHGR